MAPSLSDDIAAIARISAVPTILRVIAETTGMGYTLVARVTPGEPATRPQVGHNADIFATRAGVCRNPTHAPPPTASANITATGFPR